MVFQLDRDGGCLSGLCLCFPGRSFCTFTVQTSTAVLKEFPFSSCRMPVPLSVSSSGGTGLYKQGDSNTLAHLCFWHRAVLEFRLSTGSFLFIYWS